MKVSTPTRDKAARHGLASAGLASTGLASTGLASDGLASAGLASAGLDRARDLHRWTRRALLLSVAGLAACGFQLRGSTSLPFSSIWISLPPESEMGADLRRAIRVAGGAQIEADPARAERKLYIEREERTREIVGFTATGRPRDIRIGLQVVFRVTDQGNIERLKRSDIDLRRELVTSDVMLGPTVQQERYLYRDMLAEAVERIVRQLRAA